MKVAPRYKLLTLVTLFTVDTVVIQFCPKKAQKPPEMVDNFSYFLTLKGAGRQPNDTWSTYAIFYYFGV